MASDARSAARMATVPSDLSLLRHLLPRTSHAGSSLPTTVEQAATPAQIMDADLPLARLERAFRTPHLDCVAVHDAEQDRMGLVTRSRFFASVSGELGFGRALLARGVTADVADWSPLVLDRTTGIVEAALAVTRRSEDRRYDAVLVRAAEWRVAAPSDLIRALTSLLAVRTLRDEATGLANLAQVRLELADRLARAARTPHRVAVVVLRLDTGDAMRPEHDDAVADALVAQAAAHLRAATPSGWDLGRTGGREFALVGTLAGPIASGPAAEALDGVQAVLATSLRVGATTARLRSAAICSPQGAGDADDLLDGVRRRLAGAVPTPARRLEPAGR